MGTKFDKLVWICKAVIAERDFIIISFFMDEFLNSEILEDIRMGQSCEEEVLVWVFPNHESKTSDLEKPILALPIHRIDIPEKLKKWHQEVEKVVSGG